MNYSDDSSADEKQQPQKHLGAPAPRNDAATAGNGVAPSHCFTGNEPECKPVATLELQMPEPLRLAINHIASLCAEAGGCALVVGGGVRDALLGQPAKDLDVEVFGIDADRLEQILSAHYTLNAVGRSFGVYKVKGLELDIALPRRESKQGSGHKGFVVEGDPSMTPAQAAARRDFTLNALYWNPLNKQVLDPCGHGFADIQAGVLRHVSSAFGEDPLRVLRAMQFIARFKFSIAPQTLELCRSIESEGLPAERLFEEWSKLILKGQKPSLGLQFLRECGWVRYYPELEALIDCPQDPHWHPEGDVWTHTLHCMDAFAAARIGDEWEDLVVGLAVLLHDIGKPLTTFVAEDGRIRSPRHDSEGVPVAKIFLRRISRQQALIDAVLPLVAAHMQPVQFHSADAGDAAIRRLALRVKRIDRLVRVAAADMGGRPPLSADFPGGPWLLERAQALAVADSVPEPILLGRHLIEHFEMAPGLQMGKALKAVYEAQLDGKVCDVTSALAFARRWLRQQG